MNRRRLFNDGQLPDYLAQKEWELYSEIDAYDQDRFLGTPEPDVIQYFLDRFHVDIPVLQEPEIESEETQVDVRFLPNMYHLRERSEPVYVPGTRVIFSIPFEGDQHFFSIHSGAWRSSPTFGEIKGSELRFSVEFTDHSTIDLPQKLNSYLENVNWYLGNMRGVSEMWSRELTGKITTRIRNRKERLQNDRGIVLSLGIPVRRRSTNACIPVVEKKIKISQPGPTKSFIPEPALSSEIYDEILTVLQRMGEVMDRSPSAFSSMDEEALRTLFLVQLNATFELASTAETFNSNGKTDILMRVSGGNAFIAECKFWEGPRALVNAVNQLLSYVTWRDTKAAIILFSKRKKFTEVLDKAQTAAEEHLRFKRNLPYASANAFRGIYSHPDDPTREVTITTLVFDVPHQSAKTTNEVKPS